MVRQAAFKGLREDKPAEEVRGRGPGRRGRNRRSRRRKPRPSTRKPADAKAGPAVGVMGVTISHPDKPLWPDAGDDGQPVTKLDLARYYEAVGPWMMPHLKGRPCSIIRAPDGIAGETFFQRHAMPGRPTCSSSSRSPATASPIWRSTASRAWPRSRRSAALELHPWNCEPFHPDLPGRLVFDLDPAPDVPLRPP